jgi:hypothetical protein
MSYRRFGGNRELIDAYARATELTDRALGLEEQRVAQIKRYVAELRGVMPAVKVGRWYQVEMALNKIVDLRLAAEIPLAQ